MQCTLCRSAEARAFVAQPRPFWRCGECGYVFVDPAQHPSPEAERERYGLHRNSPDDAGYRAFLERLAGPLAAVLPEGAAGLDFGCGPGPTLSVLMEERGFRMQLHDPLFCPNAVALAHEHDFVTCSEVVEHFRKPHADWALLMRLVRPGGWLGLTTPEPPEGAAAFAAWHSQRDPTHLGFLAPRTVRAVAARHGFTPDSPTPGVWLLQRRRGFA